MPQEPPQQTTPEAAAAAGPEQIAEQAVLRRVVEQTARQLGYDEASVNPEEAFFDLGADSLSMINMIRDLERAFQVRVSMRELFEAADTPPGWRG